MRIVNEAVLEEFRSGGPCEYCGHRCIRRHPHHVYPRGMGGGSRLDVRENLVGICFGCHVEFHLGHILRCDFFAIIAAREGKLQGEIETIIFALLRAPKRSIA